MNYTISSDPYPLLRVQLAPGDVVETEAWAVVGLTGAAEISSVALKLTKLNLKAKVATKKAIVHSRFVATSPAELILTSGIIGQIIALAPPDGEGLHVAAGSYIASTDGIEFDVTLVKLSRTSRLPFLTFTGTGKTFIGASGSAHTMVLEPSETIIVERLHLLAMDASVSVEDGSESGVWPTVTGQELLQLTGPGQVVIQSLPRTPRTSPIGAAVSAITSLI
ncbi:MAG: hypothetical protein ACI9MR_004652 [Myxococcota bacterium]|jgi:uncharacterized protein (AIM24 family)